MHVCVERWRSRLVGFLSGPTRLKLNEERLMQKGNRREHAESESRSQGQPREGRCYHSRKITR
uniref:Uncharacterized protein n=1 Tax=Anguilla anguilla TaxID=7936 RepID=A0A0E9UBW1_ANGAN